MYETKQKNVIPVTGLQLVLQQNVLAGAGTCETKKSIFSFHVRVYCTLQQNVAPVSGLITALHRFVGVNVCLLLVLHRFLGEKAGKCCDWDWSYYSRVNVDCTKTIIEIGDLSNGVYVIKIVNEKGIITRKIVKE